MPGTQDIKGEQQRPAWYYGQTSSEKHQGETISTGVDIISTQTIESTTQGIVRVIMIGDNQETNVSTTGVPKHDNHNGKKNK